MIEYLMHYAKRAIFEEQIMDDGADGATPNQRTMINDIEA